MTRRTHHGPRHHSRPSHKDRSPRAAAPATSTVPAVDASVDEELAAAVAGPGTESLRVVGRQGPESVPDIELDARPALALASGMDDFGGARHVDGPGEVTHLRRSPVPGLALGDAGGPPPHGGGSRTGQREARSSPAPEGGWVPPVAETADGRASCTAPQLRRFIKSRAYVPMHELRRRFAIDGGDDEVTPVDLDAGRIFVGLPSPEGHLLGELLRAGDIGYELSYDPVSPIVVGVYPMRPVARG